MPRAPKPKASGSFISDWTQVIRDTPGAAPAAPGEAPAAPQEPRKGQTWYRLDDARSCRVMCSPVEGYVMARYRGAVPWVMHVNDWTKTFSLQKPGATNNT